MKCSLWISNFLEEISSLSHSIVFLYFFALITEEGFLISPWYSLKLSIQMGISFLSSFIVNICQSCILSPCFFNLQVEYIMQNARLDEAQAEIKIAGRNINNLRYADDITLMAEKWRGTKESLDESEIEWESWLKSQHSKKLRSWHPVPSLHGR